MLNGHATGLSELRSVLRALPVLLLAAAAAFPAGEPDAAPPGGIESGLPRTRTGPRSRRTGGSWTSPPKIYAMPPISEASLTTV